MTTVLYMAKQKIYIWLHIALGLQKCFMQKLYPSQTGLILNLIYVAGTSSKCQIVSVGIHTFISSWLRRLPMYIVNSNLERTESYG